MAGPTTTIKAKVNSKKYFGVFLIQTRLDISLNFVEQYQEGVLSGNSCIQTDDGEYS
jgi:hypothetical protein